MRRCQRAGMPVPREICRAEDDESVPDRQDPLVAARQLTVPQLQVPAVYVRPFAIKEEKCIYSPCCRIFAVDVEVRMQTKIATGEIIDAPLPSYAGSG